MIKVTERTTLKEVIREIGMEDDAYLVDPDMKPDGDASEEEKRLWADVQKGRSFGELTIEEMNRLFPSWNVPSMRDGLAYLVEKAGQGGFVYHIWGSGTPALMAFPLKKVSRFVLVCPGGGYGNVCSVAEGFPLVKKLNELGYAAFILNYRVGEEAKAPNPQDDVAQAIRFILEHAKEFCIETEAYGVMGFSAGGHLAASYGTESLGWKKYGLPRPGALLLGYPVITMKGETHGGSRRNLLGSAHEGDEMYRNKYSIEEQVTSKFPKTYVWQCEADNCVPAVNSRLLIEKLTDLKIPFMHEVFPGEDHGWGLGIGTAAEGWVERAIEFMEKG